MLQLTQAAANEIKRLQRSRQQFNSYLRLSIKQGGCSGLYYLLELSETPQAGDRLESLEGISIAIAADSYPYLEMLKLDYAEDLMGGGFRFHNSQASATCGCGLSFSSLF